MAPIGPVIWASIAVAVVRPVTVVVGSVIGVIIVIVGIAPVHIAWSKTNTDAAQSEAEANASPTPSMAMPAVPMPTVTGERV